MNKAELIQALAMHYDGSRADAAKALNAVVQTITYQAAAGEKVSITGFGVFEKVSRGERMVRNPRTGERKLAEPTAVPRFRAGTDLKAYVSGAKQLPTTNDTPAAAVAQSAAASAAKVKRTVTAVAADPRDGKTSGAKASETKKANPKKTDSKKTDSKKSLSKKPAKSTARKAGAKG